MKKILENYCIVKENFTNRNTPDFEVILYQYKQGIEFMYIGNVFTELRLGISNASYHQFKDEEKLKMFFESLS